LAKEPTPVSLKRLSDWGESNRKGCSLGGMGKYHYFFVLMQLSEIRQTL
jgi:hypothetical protein